MIEIGFVVAIMYVSIKSFEGVEYSLMGYILGLWVFGVLSDESVLTAISPQTIGLFAGIPGAAYCLFLRGKAKKLRITKSGLVALALVSSLLMLLSVFRLLAVSDQNFNFLFSYLFVFGFAVLILSNSEYDKLQHMSLYVLPSALIAVSALILIEYSQHFMEINFDSESRVVNGSRLGGGGERSLVNVWAYAILSSLLFILCLQSLAFTGRIRPINKDLRLTFILLLLVAVIIIMTLSRGALILYILILLIFFSRKVGSLLLVLGSLLILYSVFNLTTTDNGFIETFVARNLDAINGRDASVEGRFARYSEFFSAAANGWLSGNEDYITGRFSAATENSFMFAFLHGGILCFLLFSLVLGYVSYCSSKLKIFYLVSVPVFALCFFDDVVLFTPLSLIIALCALSSKSRYLSTNINYTYQSARHASAVVI